MLYYGYFGAGNNVNMNWLDNNKSMCQMLYQLILNL